MKKITLALASMILVGMSAAHADQIQLNHIDTNDCARAQNELNLLNHPDAGIAVQSTCTEGYFQELNGQVYNYRVETSVTVPFSVAAGSQVVLANIDTNDCTFAVNEVRLLNSSRVTVNPVCQPGYFVEPSGQVYSYRVTTTLTVNN